MAISVYQKTPVGPKLIQVESGLGLDVSDIIWVDLVAPDAIEEAAVEAVFGIDAPSDAERAALEESARFYIENKL